MHARSELLDPIRAAQVRDAILSITTAEFVRSVLSPKAYAARNYKADVVARDIYEIVDAVMAGRTERLDKDVAGLEAWGRRILETEGIVIEGNNEAVCCALVNRMGGMIEIPIGEIDDVAKQFAGLAVRVDQRRGVANFSLKPVKPE